MTPRHDLACRIQARVGTTLMGKYRLNAVLGIGGMAAVYAATHRNAKRAAVKILHPEWSANSNIRAHFQREGYAANSVTHGGVVRVDDDDVTEDGTFFIVMELLEGIAIEELRLRHGGRLSVHATVSIAEQVLDVLSAAHERSIVHRDVKPSNLFLIRDGSLKVLDFGIARVRDAARFGTAPFTSTGDPLGTPGFMAPEQVLGQSELVDARTDVWAASATLFMLLSGELVHAARNPHELRVCAARDAPRPLEIVAPDVPPAIARVVNRGLAMKKEARWSTANEMREALLDAHRSAFGRDPELVTERQWDPPLRRAGVSVVPTSVVAPDWPVGNVSVPSSTSDRPIALAAAPRKRIQRTSLALAVATATLATTALGFMRVGLRSGPSPVSAPQVVHVEPAAAVASIALKQGPDEPLATRAAVPRAVADGGPERMAPLPTASVLKPSLPLPRDCNPPTVIDSAGIKHPKPWCL
jgi:eukaryotic-like serine/threonine-protein kinase